MTQHIVSVVQDGMARMFSVNGNRTADQFAQIKVPTDFPPERSVALCTAVVDALNDEHGVEVRTANGHAKTLPPVKQGLSTQYDSEAVLAWINERGGANTVDVEKHFGLTHKAARNAIDYLCYKRGALKNVDHVYYPTDRAPRTRRKTSSPHKKGSYTDQPNWEACWEYLREHPGLTAAELTDQIGLRTRQDGSNRFLILREKGLIRTEAGDDGFLRAYPIEQPAAPELPLTAEDESWSST